MFTIPNNVHTVLYMNCAKNNLNFCLKTSHGWSRCNGFLRQPSTPAATGSAFRRKFRFFGTGWYRFKYCFFAARHLLIFTHTVSTTQTNFLIYSEAADSNLYIRKCFKICKILTYIFGHFSKYISLHHYLLIY